MRCNALLCVEIELAAQIEGSAKRHLKSLSEQGDEPEEKGTA
jgi:hypothetical protein